MPFCTNFYSEKPIKALLKLVIQSISIDGVKGFPASYSACSILYVGGKCSRYLVLAHDLNEPTACESVSKESTTEKGIRSLEFIIWHDFKRGDLDLVLLFLQ